MATRVGCISVDLDSLHHYCSIHGLPDSLLSEDARALVYTRALPRFLELMATLGLPSTLFAIGEDAQMPWAARVLAQAHAGGVEIGNHSGTHPYALTRLAPEELARDVQRGADAIAAAVGTRPQGFRAPGYTLNAALYGVLEQQGYAYDSSTFPAVPYYLAKASIMAVMRLFGRRSRAVLDSPRVCLAPRLPYRPRSSAPYSRGTGNVLELPVTVAPVTRLPFIGTLAVVLPPGLMRAVYATLWRTPLVNFELHGADFLDVSDGIPPELVAVQRDLQVPVAVKVDRLRRVFETMRRDLEIITLAAAAGRFPALP